MGTDHIHVDGGFDEHDIFLSRPVIVPPHNLTVVAKNEDE